MNSHNFFRTIWRVNAIVILLAASAIALGAGALLLQEFRFDRYNRSNQAELRVDASNPELRLVLGQATEVAHPSRLSASRPTEPTASPPV